MERAEGQHLQQVAVQRTVAGPPPEVYHIWIAALLGDLPDPADEHMRWLDAQAEAQGIQNGPLCSQHVLLEVVEEGHVLDLTILVPLLGKPGEQPAASWTSGAATRMPCASQKTHKPEEHARCISDTQSRTHA